MAAELLNAVGPRANHRELYGLAAPHTLVTTPAPADGNYRIRATGATSARTALSAPVGSAVTKDNVWAVLREWREAATMTSGDIAGILGWQALGGVPHEVVAAGQGGGGWKARIRDSGGNTLAEGDTLYSTGAIDRDVRVTMNGVSCIVEIDGAVEMTLPYTLLPPNTTLYIPLVNFAGQDTFWTNFLLCQSDDPADRPAPDVEIGKQVPDSNPGTYTDYGDQADCFDDTLGHYENWDDYAGTGGANTADYNCSTDAAPPSGTRGKEVSGLSNNTLSNPTILGVLSRYWARQTDGATGKPRHKALLYYSGTLLSVELAQWVLQTAWRKFQAVFQTPPGGGAWTQAKLDGLHAGHERITSSAAVIVHVSGVVVEQVAINADPTPPPGHTPGRELINRMPFRV